MAGIFYSLLAGIVIAIQGAMNTRLGEKVGFWLTNSFVHGSGFIVSFIIYLFIRDGHLGQFQSVNKGYLFGGALGVLIVFSVMQGMGRLGTAYSVAFILVAQLIFALIIDSMGLFGVTKTPLQWNKLAGIGVMIGGILIFKGK
ncbi:DMT family transporter [Paenibacillus monticola]|uniref:EamA-like transporter family protein n=1 Tax=Paenibacillus monticola TaxID=2666075 RepID=A0A7X2H332_9BACL|nr:DMT family transporter [Paenibacillus monticola]MRN52625.1 EamA-like transporter family protein [Paenibacillus monticola]